MTKTQSRKLTVDAAFVFEKCHRQLFNKLYVTQNVCKYLILSAVQIGLPTSLNVQNKAYNMS